MTPFLSVGEQVNEGEGDMEIQKYAPGRTMVTGTDQTNTNSNKRNSVTN